MNEFWRLAGSIPWGVWIAIVAILCVFTIVVLSLLYARSNRELLHAERVSAIEAGLPWQKPEPVPDPSPDPGAKFMHNAFWISFWIVSGVPGAGFSAASAATKEFDQLAIGITAWSAAAVASVAAIVCATNLMIYSRSRNEPRDSYSSRADLASGGK